MQFALESPAVMTPEPDDGGVVVVGTAVVVVVVGGIVVVGVGAFVEIGRAHV